MKKPSVFTPVITKFGVRFLDKKEFEVISFPWDLSSKGIFISTRRSQISQPLRKSVRRLRLTKFRTPCISMEHTKARCVPLSSFLPRSLTKESLILSCAFFLHCGYNVVTYDHPGYCLQCIDADYRHGKSKGKRSESSTLDEAERVFLYVDEHYGRSGTTLKR